MYKSHLVITIGIFINSLSANCLASEISDEEKLVNQAIESMESCLHWGGEVGDQSEERNKQIIEAEKRDCGKADKYVNLAYEKYPNNITLASQLVRYVTEDFMSVNSEELAIICRNAERFYKENKKDKYPIRYWYFEYKCMKLNGQ